MRCRPMARRSGNVARRGARQSSSSLTPASNGDFAAKARPSELVSSPASSGSGMDTASLTSAAMSASVT